MDFILIDCKEMSNEFLGQFHDRVWPSHYFILMYGNVGKLYNPKRIQENYKIIPPY